MQLATSADRVTEIAPPMVGRCVYADRGRSNSCAAPEYKGNSSGWPSLGPCNLCGGCWGVGTFLVLSLLRLCIYLRARQNLSQINSLSLLPLLFPHHDSHKGEVYQQAQKKREWICNE